MKKFKFKAKIKKGVGGGAYVFFPFNVEKEFGVKGLVPIKATFDGVPYTGSLFKYRFPQHILAVLKPIREKIGKREGDMVEVVVIEDKKERTVEIPLDFKKALSKFKLMAVFNSLSFTHQKEYCRWIIDAKKEETRLSRLDKSIKMLQAGVKTPV